MAKNNHRFTLSHKFDAPVEKVFDAWDYSRQTRKMATFKGLFDEIHQIRHYPRRR